MWIGLASNVVAALISHIIIQNWSVGVHKIIELSSANYILKNTYQKMA